MPRRLPALVLVLLAVRLAPGADPLPPDVRKLPPAHVGRIDFGRDVGPILTRACVSCHNATKQRGGLRLDDGVAALQGGNSGKALVPGDVGRSRLLFVVAGLDAELRMPPEGKPPLTPREVGVLRAWVEQGATWPAAASTTAARATSDHWAFRSVRRPVPATVRDEAWVRTGVDRFVLARLEAEGLAPNPEADRATLLRRLSLDLLGLPPSPEEVDAFLADDAPAAYERLVDRLLASPHYGERWARHWLDLARYADSDGYEKDTGRPFAWRYRQWVIDALNRDLPFDQFTLEQLAGDLLPGATAEQKVATGFHRNTLTNREGGVDREQFRVEAVVDRVNTTAKVWLGVTLACAQCHDHKYDPFSQREYYQLFAFFNSDVEVDLPAPRPGDGPGAEARRTAWEKRREELRASLKEAQAAAGKRKDDPGVAAATATLNAHEKAAPPQTLAQTLAQGPARATKVMVRGDFLRPGAEVQPGTPAVLPPLTAGQPTRLDLARWLVDPAHPLTARVAVNGLWQHHFGRGLVATPEDFGTQGEKPSHPELLDWLASELPRQGWSLKRIHRLLVTSAAYRQSSAVRPAVAARDPINVLLARQSRLRLEAETLRDAALAVSGLLTRVVGGPSVRPPQPAGIAELTYAGSAKWVESVGPDRYRRGLYTWFQRTSPYPMLLTFDAPDSNVCCVRRERSNTPLQALTLLNDAVFVECARGLARRAVGEVSARGTSTETTAARLAHGFRLAVGRAPTAEEREVLGRLFAGLRREAERNQAAAKLTAGWRPDGVTAAEAAAWVAIGRALLNLDEFVTRE